ncbi:MAG: DUF2812 domain-containing protein [Clostridiaceae bacterium]
MLKIKNMGYYNYPSIEKWYEELASKGWAIDRVFSDFIHRFKKIEPTERKYKIVLFDKERAFSAFSHDEMHEFYNMCSGIGWNHVASVLKLEIFYSSDPDNTAQIYEEREEERLLFGKVMNKELILAIIMVILMLLYLFLIPKFFTTSRMLVDNTTLALGISMVLVIPILIIKAINIIKFWYMNEEAWEDASIPIKYTNPKSLKLFFAASAIGLIIGFSWMISSLFTPYNSSLNFRIIIQMLPYFIITGVIVILRKVIKENDNLSINKKRSFYIVSLTFAVILILVIMNSFVNPGIFYNKHDGDKIVTTSDKILTLGTENKYDIWEEKSSIFVPRSIWVTTENPEYRIETKYFKAINGNISKILENSIIDEDKAFSKKFTSDYRIEDLNPDVWKSDRALFLGNSNLLLLRKGKELWALNINGANLDTIKTDEMREKIIHELGL